MVWLTQKSQLIFFLNKNTCVGLSHENEKKKVKENIFCYSLAHAKSSVGLAPINIAWVWPTLDLV